MVLPRIMLLFLVIMLTSAFFGCESSDPQIADGDGDSAEAEAEGEGDGDLDEKEIDSDYDEEVEMDGDEDVEDEIEIESENDRELESEKDLEPESEAEPRMYSVRDGAIRTEDGHYLYLRGTNVSNLAKYAEDHLFNLTEEDIRVLKTSGINSVRLLTFWNAIAPQDNGSFNAFYLQAYLDRLKMLTEAGIYVIVDMHQDLWGVPFQPHGAPDWACPAELKEGFVWQSPWWMNYLTPQVSACFDHFFEHLELQEKFAFAWAEMAAMVCDDPMMIGFDLINEPFVFSGIANPAFDNEVLAPFYRRVMDTIEAVCPGRLYFWEHSAGFVAKLTDPYDIPKDLADRVVVSPHFYPTSVHEADEVGYTNTLEELENQLMSILQPYVDAEVPLWMGEYGGMAANPGFGEYMKQIHTIFLKYGISSAQYDYTPSDGGFAFIDSKRELKDVYKPVFLLPVPSELPMKPDAMTADWDLGRMTTAFDCLSGKRIKVTMPSAYAECLFDPPDRVADFTASLGQSMTSCLADGPVIMTCSRAPEPDGDLDGDQDGESELEL